MCAFHFILQISLLGPHSVSTLHSTIQTSLHQTSKDMFSSPYHSIWLFTCHVRALPKSCVHLLLADLSLDCISFFPISS